MFLMAAMNWEPKKCCNSSEKQAMSKIVIFAVKGFRSYEFWINTVKLQIRMSYSWDIFGLGVS